jgi:hypothetical protein
MDMVNIEKRSPRRWAVFFGCALAALALVRLASSQNVLSALTVRTKANHQATGNSRATPPFRAPAEIVGTRQGTVLGRLEPATKARLIETYDKLPLRFEGNRGQTDGQVKFLSRAHGYSLFLTATEAVLALRKPSPMSARSSGENLQIRELLLGPKPFARSHESGTPRPEPLPPAVHMRLVGANPKAVLVGLDELPGKSNYFIGNDPKKWLTNVPTYKTVRYKNVYPGVDLVYHGNQGQLEYDFVVAPGADPGAIALKINGQHLEVEAPLKGETETHARIGAHGDLIVPTEGGEVFFHKPLVYQRISDSGSKSSRSYIESQYVLTGGNITFQVGEYDRGRTLIIDPVLTYSRFLGGTMDDFGNALTVDSSGNVYVAGGTTSSNFPVTPGVVQTSYAGADGGYQSVQGDIFVTKLNPSGSGLVFSTYMGGSGDDNAYGISVNATGNVYLTGGTNSANFPVTPGVYQPSSGGLTDVFLTKLDPTGSKLLYSTHIGVGGEGIRGFGIAVDDAGSAYVTGNAGPGFPTTPGAFQTGSGAFTSAYVMKLNPTGSAADYSTFLSGGNIDYGESIAVDANNNAYVTGYASSPGFPTTAGALQTALGGGTDAFVTVLNAAGSALLYSTFLGGAANDEGFKIALDPLGKVYVTGVTGSSNFPTTSGAFQTAFGGGNTDAFVAKVDTSKAGAASLVYSTLLGGSGDENFQPFLRDILAVDTAGNAYVTGATTSTNFPTVNPLQASSGGGFDAYVAKLNATGSGLIYSTYLGGSGDDFGRGIALDSHENVYLTGQTSSANFPVTPNSFQAAFGGSTDAFVAKLIPISLSPSALTFGNQNVGGTSAAQTITLINEKNATPLNITGISTSGDFAETDTCGTSLAAGLQCTLSVTFVPTVPGSRSGSITLTDDASSTPQIVALSGTGIGPFVTLGAGNASFGNQLVGTTATAQVVTLTNSGNAPLTINSIALSGANSGDFTQTNTCPGSNATLAANANCAISITFTPTVAGNRSANVTITDNAPGSPHIFSLSGTGTDYSLAAATAANCPVGGNCSTSALIAAGQTASYDLQVTPNGGFNGTVALTCTGAPGASICSISAASVPLNGSSSYAFVVTVSNTSNVMVMPLIQMPYTPAAPMVSTTLALFLILAAILILRSDSASNHRRRVLAPALVVLLLGVLYASACGGGRPPTNATLTVTGASGGVSRTLSLNLTVNH